MKLLLLTTLVATICYVNAGKTARLLAALAGMNGGVVGGVNGGLGGMNGALGGMNGALGGMNGALGGMNGALGGMNGALGGMNGALGGMNAALVGGVNGRLANGAVPAVVAGGLNPPVVVGGVAGVWGQPQLVQFVPAYAVPAPVPNVNPVNTINAVGVPQMALVNPPQQPLVGATGIAMQQQLPLQPDPARRFRRQSIQQRNALKTTVDTQIPTPTEAMTTTGCDKEGRLEDN